MRLLLLKLAYVHKTDIRSFFARSVTVRSRDSVSTNGVGVFQFLTIHKNRSRRREKANYWYFTFNLHTYLFPCRPVAGLLQRVVRTPGL